jgi:anti-sigma B factor antagonist
VAAHVTIEVQIHSPTASVVTLRGEHDLSSRPDLALALADAGEHRNVLVDLSESTFIDSSIISALLLASKRLQERDGALELVIPPAARAMRRVMEVTGVQEVLPSHETREAGLASIDSHQPRRDADRVSHRAALSDARHGETSALSAT